MPLHHLQNLQPQRHRDGGDRLPIWSNLDHQSAASVTVIDGDDEPDGKRKTSTWTRMKWSDQMVRILIMSVYLIDDDDEETMAVKKKQQGGGGFRQRKGKWKTVSGAMAATGVRVSPQQCEDKFNDLNKRYKRAVDILGIGTCSRAVVNPGLIDKLDHLSPTVREQVKKLITCKHLFFKEMFDYHNGSGYNGGDNNCEHHDEEIDRVVEYSPMVQELEAEMTVVLQDETKNTVEKTEWMKGRLAGLERRRMNIVSQSFELRKERFKWVKFSMEKEREMERHKLTNERLKLENERMALLIRQKLLDLLHNHHLSREASTEQQN